VNKISHYMPQRIRKYIFSQLFKSFFLHTTLNFFLCVEHSLVHPYCCVKFDFFIFITARIFFEISVLKGLYLV